MRSASSKSTVSNRRKKIRIRKTQCRRTQRIRGGESSEVIDKMVSSVDKIIPESDIKDKTYDIMELIDDLGDFSYDASDKSVLNVKYIESVKVDIKTTSNNIFKIIGELKVSFNKTKDKIQSYLKNNNIDGVIINIGTTENTTYEILKQYDNLSNKTIHVYKRVIISFENILKELEKNNSFPSALKQKLINIQKRLNKKYDALTIVIENDKRTIVGIFKNNESGEMIGGSVKGMIRKLKDVFTLTASVLLSGIVLNIYSIYINQIIVKYLTMIASDGNIFSYPTITSVIVGLIIWMVEATLQ
jgi:hypothetical protein